MFFISFILSYSACVPTNLIFSTFNVPFFLSHECPFLTCNFHIIAHVISHIIFVFIYTLLFNDNSCVPLVASGRAERVVNSWSFVFYLFFNFSTFQLSCKVLRAPAGVPDVLYCYYVSFFIIPVNKFISLVNVP